MGFMDKAKQRALQAQQKLEESGALDKAKQAAQQAQQKIEEKQQEVNRRQGDEAAARAGQPPQGGGPGAPP
ncbi:MAG: hypothetical protein ACR2IN_10600, partial [Thermoleophilaceae bacterium]